MPIMTELINKASTWGPVAWVVEHDHILWWVVIASSVISVATLLAAPWLVCVIPEDYFATKERPKLRGRSRAPVLRWTLRILKNLAGLILVVLGLFMIPLPGQGMLVTLAGLLLLQFPGKRRLEMWLIRRPGLLRLINWLRCQRGRQPLRVWSPEHDHPVTTRTPCGPVRPEKTHVISH